MVEVVEVLSILSSTNLHSPPPTSTNLSIIRNDRDALRAPPPVRPARRRAPPLPAVARARRVHGSGGLAGGGPFGRGPPPPHDGRGSPWAGGPKNERGRAPSGLGEGAARSPYASPPPPP